jgi:hypothetical protein
MRYAPSFDLIPDIVQEATPGLWTGDADRNTAVLESSRERRA